MKRNRPITLLWSGTSQKNAQGLPDRRDRIGIGSDVGVTLWAYLVAGFYSGPNLGDPFDSGPIEDLVSVTSYAEYDGNVSLFGGGHPYQSPPAPADAWPALVVGFTTTIDNTRHDGWALADPDHEGAIIAQFGKPGNCTGVEYHSGLVGGRLWLPSPFQAWTMRYEIGKTNRVSAYCGLWLEKFP